MMDPMSVLRYPDGLDFFNCWMNYETEEEQQKLLKEADAKRLQMEVEFLEMEREAKRKRRERLESRIQANMTKMYENMRKGIDTTLLEEEDPRMIKKERKAKEQREFIDMLRQKKYEILPPIVTSLELRRMQTIKKKKKKMKLKKGS